MKKHNEKFEKNIARLVKSTGKQQVPSGNFTSNLIDEALKELPQDEPRQQTMSSFFYYAAASAAMLLIGISVLYDNTPTIPSQIASIYSDTKPKLTLAKLNAVFDVGGQKALDDYFEVVEQNRQPRAETLTLQQIMSELYSKGH